MIRSIAAVDENLGIGRSGDIPWTKIKDLKFFKFMTVHEKLVMGRKTYDNIGSPLPNRKIFVLSNTKNGYEENENGTVNFVTMEEFNQIYFNIYDDYYLAGGKSIYNQFFDVTEELILTNINEDFQCDTFFPKFQDDFKKVVSFSLTENMTVERWRREDLLN